MKSDDMTPLELEGPDAAELETAEDRRCPFCPEHYKVTSWGVSHAMVDGELRCARFEAETAVDFLAAARGVN